MSDRNHDIAFTGSIPAFYEIYMVPMIFAPYAAAIGFWPILLIGMGIWLLLHRADRL